MSNWGIRSYNSDTCHDILDRLSFKDKDAPNVKMIEHLLTNYCSPSRVDTDYDSYQELYLGVVMWGLHHGVIVARKRLQHALKCAKHLMNDSEYIDNWKNSKKRMKSIQQEMDQIQKWLSLSPKEFKVQKAVGSI